MNFIISYSKVLPGEPKQQRVLVLYTETWLYVEFVQHRNLFSFVGPVSWRLYPRGFAKALVNLIPQIRKQQVLKKLKVKALWWNSFIGWLVVTLLSFVFQVQWPRGFESFQTNTWSCNTCCSVDPTVTVTASAQVDDSTPLHHLFLSAPPCSSWSRAAVGPCMRYAWGSPLKHIIPNEWVEFNNKAMNTFPTGYYRPLDG